MQAGWGFGGCGVPGHTLEVHVEDLVRITRARVLDLADPKGPPEKA